LSMPNGTPPSSAAGPAASSAAARGETPPSQPARRRRSAVIVLLLVAFAFSCQRHSDLPKLFPVPGTQLVDETGKPVTLDAMKGSVTVYDFIFTTCRGTCPIMTSNMRALTKEIDRDAPVRFVSISVDPSRDTPQVLAVYAKRVRNDPRWTFLTGKREDIVRLSVQGFKLAAGDPGPGGDPLLHSSKFAVADKEGVIRAYYDATDGSVTPQIAKAVTSLVRE